MIKIIQKVSPNTRIFTSSCVQHSEIARCKMQKWEAGSEKCLPRSGRRGHKEPRGFACALSLHASQDRQPPTPHLPAVILNPRIGIEIQEYENDDMD